MSNISEEPVEGSDDAASEEEVIEAVAVDTSSIVAIGFESISDRLVQIGTAITELDKDLSAHEGIMADIENRAKAHSRTVNVKDFFGGENTAFTLSTNMTVGEYLDTLSSHLSEAQTFASLIGTAWLVENRPSGDAAKAKSDEREALVAKWGQLLGTLEQFDVDISSFPTLPPAPSRKSVKGASATKSGAKFYRIKNGQKSYYSGGSNSISILCNLLFGVGVDTLRERLRLDNGGQPLPETVAWHGTTTLNGKTVEWGWEIEERSS